MAFLVLIACAVTAGFVLYLPFLLWFRRKRRRGELVGDERQYTRSGFLLGFIALLVFVAGLALPGLAPEFWLAAMIQGEHGGLRWGLLVILMMSVAEMVLLRARIPLWRKATAAPVASAVKQNTGLWRAWRLVTVRGTPVLVHTSAPLGGICVAAFAHQGLVASVGYCLAFFALIVIHEFGHFVAARLVKLRVLAIHIVGFGGSCHTQLPRGVKDSLILFMGGLAAQMLLLGLTLACVAVIGYPESPLGRSLVTTFTVVNLVIAAVNLVPGQTAEGLSTDGAVLWELLLHVIGCGPHPLAPQHAASPVLAPETRLTTMDDMVPEGFQVGVEMLNDDVTPMEFVVAMLEKHGGLDRESAIAAMLRTHSQGGLLLPMPDSAEAEKAAQRVTQEARALGYPLICRVARISEQGPPPA